MVQRTVVRHKASGAFASFVGIDLGGLCVGGLGQLISSTLLSPDIRTTVLISVSSQEIIPLGWQDPWLSEVPNPLVSL